MVIYRSIICYLQEISTHKEEQPHVKQIHEVNKWSRRTMSQYDHQNAYSSYNIPSVISKTIHNKCSKPILNTSLLLIRLCIKHIHYLICLEIEL